MQRKWLVCALGVIKGKTHLSLLGLGGAIQAQVEEGLQHIQHLGHLGEDEGLVPASLQLVQQLCQLLQSSSQTNKCDSAGILAAQPIAPAHLKLATIKLQQPPVWKEQLPSHNGGPETGRAPEPLMLCMLGLPGSLQDNRLVRVGAPGGGGWGPCLGYDDQKLLHAAEAIDDESPRANATKPADLPRLASTQVVAALQCQQASRVGVWTEPIAAAVRLALAQTPEPQPLPAG
ncbi:MAG: hypothetical protein FRX49_11241 [Trebouxia sp. A1-2]|nr:MAG: hypothetical protein FRX49_11241 [Trebouxia sp. A1-2]